MTKKELAYKLTEIYCDLCPHETPFDEALEEHKRYLDNNPSAIIDGLESLKEDAAPYQISAIDGIIPDVKKYLSAH